MPLTTHPNPLIDTLNRSVTSATLQRGRRYAADGAVLDFQVAPDLSTVVGRVAGTHVYEACLYLVEYDDELMFAEGDCDCPVGYNCKHVVALALTFAEQLPSLTATASVAPWEALLDAALAVDGTADADAVPLGLRLSVALLPQGQPGVKLSAKLVEPGKTGWVNSGLTWSNLKYSRGANPRHLRVLHELYLLHQASSSYTYAYSTKTLDLTMFGRQLWPLLDEIRAAGVELLYPKKNLGHIPRPGSARIEADVRTHADGLTVTPQVTVDGDESRPSLLGFVGAPAHGIVYVTDDDVTGLTGEPKFTDLPFRLARLDTSPPEMMQHLLLTGGSIPVPRDDAPRFSAQYLPRLRRTATVVSSDDSYEAPAVSGPRLRLTAHYRPAHTVDLDWRFVYRVGDAEHAVPVTPQPGENFRDLDAEQRVLVDLDLQRPQGTLTGLDTLRFTTETLPLLQSDDRLDVVIEGRPADYRDVGDTLEIGLATDATTGTDWFDLEVTVTVDGRIVPFRDIFAALDAGETHLLLDDGAHLALDKPELRRLRELLTEARTLRDKDGERLQLSRFQAGLWEELTGLGVVRRQAAQWRTQVQGLLDVASSATTAVPDDLDATLRPYQVDGFRWLAFLRTHGLGGILADDMGLGKTLQSLALICHAHREHPDAAPVLIVAPTSVVGNWVSEAARFAPGLRVVAVTETSTKRGAPLAESIAGADVIVTSYTLLRLDADEYLARPWSMLLLDEAQFVKNHQSKTYQCVRRVESPVKIAITGTPMENNLMELWSMLSITAPGLFPEPKAFADTYRKPIESGSAPEMLERLRRRIKPLMLRRTKEQVASDLPAKQEQVLEIDLSPKHRKLYDTHLQRERRKILGLVDDLDRNRFTILQSLTLLRRLSLDAALLDDKHAAVPSAKIDALLEQLADVIAGGHRALVFSQFTGFLARVRDRLDADGIEYAYLDGKTRARARVIDAFKTGSAPVFLISLKSGGFGLNLTEADYCFLLDPWWNPATEAQAVDRTHRIGQTRNVMVYRLIARDTIEDKVTALQGRKSALFDAVVDGDGAFGSALTADDIRELLG
ncbi:DEAD/DEAH box helicase [Prescottella subtropica]|uniref:DEAD/DEAH box helicase n=1 Tax=Prescottella subtropica TaxID=2545757 RepID=UPI001F50036B|nr:DEAD/DEAH box helicase [Prescottella subtropica]